MAKRIKTPKIEGKVIEGFVKNISNTIEKFIKR